ncbi:ankyrin [Penicillium atrosanguineum]|uniref:Ankyrin n=1 Tax=Penicillium atrosanguineum TaxID=1132637 RepID=A0A9W9PU53_9EURO|nr:ankyrin [Penicillium atrosanguineum]KAJ5311405.1 ankyrin [Penicillium atrosanguineum]
MQAAADIGDLAELQSLLRTWETQTVDGILAISKDHEWFTPTVPEQFEIFNELNRAQQETKSIYTNWYIFNRLLNAASRSNQVAIVKFLLDQGCAITSSAVQKAMAKEAYDVLEVYLENGWNINQPIRNNLCPILREVVINETKTRWCLEHGANPNAHSKNKSQDVLSHAARFASLHILELLVSYGANFANSNALHHATDRKRLDVMRWLLEQQAFPINQREHEYDTELFLDHQSDGLGTALHLATKKNCVETLRFLLEQGIDSNKPDSRGKTAYDLAQESNDEEIISILETENKQ